MYCFASSRSLYFLRIFMFNRSMTKYMENRRFLIRAISKRCRYSFLRLGMVCSFLSGVHIL